MGGVIAKQSGGEIAVMNNGNIGFQMRDFRGRSRGKDYVECLPGKPPLKNTRHGFGQQDSVRVINVPAQEDAYEPAYDFAAEVPALACRAKRDHLSAVPLQGF